MAEQVISDTTQRAARNAVVRAVAEVLGKVATLAWTVAAARMLPADDFEQTVAVAEYRKERRTMKGYLPRSTYYADAEDFDANAALRTLGVDLAIAAGRAGTDDRNIDHCILVLVGRDNTDR